MNLRSAPDCPVIMTELHLKSGGRAWVSEGGQSVTEYKVENHGGGAIGGKKHNSAKRESSFCESTCGIVDIVSDTGSFSCY